MLSGEIFFKLLYAAKYPNLHRKLDLKQEKLQMNERLSWQDFQKGNLSLLNLDLCFNGVPVLNILIIPL